MAKPFFPFQYKRLLGSTHFRILELLPGNSSSIQCRIHEKPIIAAGAYEAVSYAWGSTSQCTYLECDGAQVVCGQNLYAALLQYRRPVQTRMLWVDSVCINQSDLVEREEQVKMMRDIYSQASSVLVWLGEDEVHAAGDAFATMEMISQACCQASGVRLDDLRHHDDLYEIATADTDVTTDRNLSITKVQWDAVRWVLLRPWFERIWVIQEVNLNTIVTVNCGDKTIDWDRLGLAATYMWAYDDFLLPTAGKYDTLNAFTMRRREKLKDWDPLMALHTGRDFRASDLRDKIYGMTGLQCFAKFAAPDNKDFPINYSLSMFRAYQAFATYHIEQSNTLDALSYVEHDIDPISTNSVSWVPRWDESGIFNRHSNEHHVADGSVDAHATFVGDALLIRGVAYQTIRSCEIMTLDDSVATKDSTTGTGDVDAVLRIWLRERQQQASSPAPRYVNGDSLDLALASTFTFGWTRGVLAKRDPDAFLRDFAAYLLRVLDHSPSIENYTKQCARQWISSGVTEAEKGLWFRYARAAVYDSKNRAIFVTRDGYYGLGPKIVKAGDVVCVLPGMKTPAVLRGRMMGGALSSYVFVGECYVHGIMGGEVMQEMKSGLVKSQVLEIR